MGQEWMREPDWMPILGTGARYFVNKTGQVRNDKGRILRTWDNGTGYDFVTLYLGGVKVNKRCHRLVAEHFIDGLPPADKDCVLHEDDEPRNNHVGNLRWGDRSENYADWERNKAFRRASTRTIQTSLFAAST